MFDKQAIEKISSWRNVDYVCLKAKSGDICMAVYYLDGHPLFESTLSDANREFMMYTKALGCYGISEKVFDGNKGNDRFYVRVNIKDERQQNALLVYLTQGKSISSEQTALFEHLSNLQNIVNSPRDYRSLYYCGFSKQADSIDLNGIRFYFKTFGSDESVRRDVECINYLGECPIIRNDTAFKVVKNLILHKEAGLRCIGIEFVGTSRFKIKYYLCEIPNGKRIQELVYALTEYSAYKRDSRSLAAILPDISGLRCNWLQLTTGFFDGDESINMYIDALEKVQKQFYCLKDGLVLRKIGGISFLIDVHEKHYYDVKKLFSINETGWVIIDYLLSNGVCSIDGIVSHLRTKIVNYTPELYSVIYDDCKIFLKTLQSNGYLVEAK